MALFSTTQAEPGTSFVSVKRIWDIGWYWHLMQTVLSAQSNHVCLCHCLVLDLWSAT